MIGPDAIPAVLNSVTHSLTGRLRVSCDTAATKASKSDAAEDKAGGKSSAAPAPSAPAGGENSVYRIGLDGSVREVFREKTLVLSLLRQGGHRLHADVEKCFVELGAKSCRHAANRYCTSASGSLVSRTMRV